MLDIRPLEAPDRDIWADLWRDYLTFYETSRGPEVYEATWQRIHDPDEAMFGALAVLDGMAVGLVHFLYHRAFWDIEDRCYLNDLFVRPETRGSGAGRALIAHVVADATSRNAARVYWLTHRDNAPARALYDKVAHLSPFLKYDI